MFREHLTWDLIKLSNILLLVFHDSTEDVCAAASVTCDNLGANYTRIKCTETIIGIPRTPTLEETVRAL